MSYGNFEELEVWKKGRILKNELRELTNSFPAVEKYRLTDQIIRSSRSVCSQIAEGHGRQSFPDKIRFCIIARGSLSETLNHIIHAFDEKYIDNTKLDYFRKKIVEIDKMLNGYILYLQKKLKSS